MIKKYKILLFAGLLALPLTFSSCKKYLDVNQNPNVAQDATPAVLLTSAQLGIGSAMGVDFQINGSYWVQYWTQHYSTSQYRYLERYAPTGNNYDNLWGLCYSDAQADLKQMEKKAIEQNLLQYVAVSKLLQAYLWQNMTDAWGDIPYSEALKGLPEDGGITAPAYDRQQDIYNSLIAMVKEAQGMIDFADPNHPGNDDLIYEGDMERWYQFSNTLLLKLYLRLSERDPGTAAAGIATLPTGSENYIGDGQDAQIQYVNEAGNNHPLYSEMAGLNFSQNMAASRTSVDSLLANNDERVFAFYDPAATGAFIGLQQGFYDITTNPSLSFPSAYVGARASNSASADAPVKLMTSYGSLLLQAEAAAHGWMGGDEKELFDAAITASFNVWQLDLVPGDYIDQAYWGTYPLGGTINDRVRHIITQKWFCMNGTQGFEAWTEWRRTGYPDFLEPSVNSELGAGQIPVRFLYPNTELTRNPKFPGQVTVVDKVWWDL